eukprot:62109_1
MLLYKKKTPDKSLMSLANSIGIVVIISLFEATHTCHQFDGYYSDNFRLSTVWTNGVLDSNVTATHNFQLDDVYHPFIDAALNTIYFRPNQAPPILPSVSPHIPTHTQPTSNSSSIRPCISPKQSISSSIFISAPPPYLAHLTTPTQAPSNTSYIFLTQHPSNAPSISATQSSYNVSLRKPKIDAHHRQIWLSEQNISATHRVWNLENNKNISSLTNWKHFIIDLYIILMLIAKNVSSSVLCALGFVCTACALNKSRHNNGLVKCF